MCRAKYVVRAIRVARNYLRPSRTLHAATLDELASFGSPVTLGGFLRVGVCEFDGNTVAVERVPLIRRVNVALILKQVVRPARLCIQLRRPCCTAEWRNSCEPPIRAGCRHIILYSFS